MSSRPDANFMKKAFYLLLFISFVFLFIYLIRQEYIIPEVVNLPLLIISFTLLFAGFFAQAFSWKVALDIHDYPATLGDAVTSQGMSVFAKYIPGKIWVILGRASYLSENKKELKNRSFISFKEQAVYLWAGFMVSAVPTIIFYGLHWISFLVLSIITGLSLFLFVEKVHHWTLHLIRRIARRELEIPLVRIRQSFPMIGAVLLVWCCWTGGFFLFMMAFSHSITPVMMFSFPLSVCFGLIAILLPAGLGLREGIIIGYLVLAGLDVETATTISFFNRLWFICGEVFIFLLALVIRLARKKASG